MRRKRFVKCVALRENALYANPRYIRLNNRVGSQSCNLRLLRKQSTATTNNKNNKIIYNYYFYIIWQVFQIIWEIIWEVKHPLIV